jgi:hypothetical protein
MIAIGTQRHFVSKTDVAIAAVRDLNEELIAFVFADYI